MRSMVKAVAVSLSLAALILTAGSLPGGSGSTAQARDRDIILRHGDRHAPHGWQGAGVWHGRAWQRQGRPIGHYPGAYRVYPRRDFGGRVLYHGRYPQAHERYVPRTYRGWRYRHYDVFGPGLAAGVLSGVILGGMLGPYDAYDYGPGYYVVPPPVYVPRGTDRVAGLSQAHYDWCYARYRSYRAYDNTFQPYHGPRRPCFSPY